MYHKTMYKNRSRSRSPRRVLAEHRPPKPIPGPFVPVNPFRVSTVVPSGVPTIIQTAIDELFQTDKLSVVLKSEKWMPFIVKIAKSYCTRCTAQNKPFENHILLRHLQSGIQKACLAHAKKQHQVPVTKVKTAVLSLDLAPAQHRAAVALVDMLYTGLNPEKFWKELRSSIDEKNYQVLILTLQPAPPSFTCRHEERLMELEGQVKHTEKLLADQSGKMKELEDKHTAEMLSNQELVKTLNGRHQRDKDSTVKLQAQFKHLNEIITKRESVPTDLGSLNYQLNVQMEANRKH